MYILQGRHGFHQLLNLKDEVTAAQFTKIPAVQRQNDCTLCLTEGESLKLFKTDQSSTKLMPLIGQGPAVEVEVLTALGATFAIFFV